MRFFPWKSHSCRSWLPVVCLLAAASSLRGGEPDGPLGPEAVMFCDRQTVCVMLSDARRLDWIDLESGRCVAGLELPARPNALCPVRSAAGGQPVAIFVACGGPDGLVVQVDPASRQIVRRFPAGHTPSGMAYARSTGRLYVANRFDNRVQVIPVGDVCAATVQTAAAETAAPSPARLDLYLPARREPIALALTPDERLLLVANLLPAGRSIDSIVTAVVTIHDLIDGTSRDVLLADGSHSLRDILVTPNGRLAFVPHIQSNFNTITSQVAGGWINRNAMSVIDLDRPDFSTTYLLDDYGYGAGNPWALALTPDAASLVVAQAGTDELSVIDMADFTGRIHRGQSLNRIQRNMLFAPGSLQPAQYRVTLPIKGPRAVAADNTRLVAVGYFSDALCVIDRGAVERLRGQAREKKSYSYASAEEKASLFQPSELRTIPLRSPSPLSPERLGEQLFHDATVCLGDWQSCASCHPDGRVDGLNWDLLNDGVGNPKNTKSMLLAHATPPSMASGVRETAETAVRAGYHHILFTHLEEEEYQAVDAYLKSLRPIPSPHLVGGELSESARRGKQLFEGPEAGCAACHNGPYFTDLGMYDVGSQGERDFRDDFDTPTLIEVWRTAPYLHDGRYTTIEQLLFEGRHGNADGSLGALSDRQRADLIEYILSL